MARKPAQHLEGRLSRAATVGEYFTAELLEPAGLTRIDVDWPADTDLMFEQNKATGNWVISGTVHTAKMYEFSLRGVIANTDVTVNLRLPASPDPWTIWKDHPVDWDSLPYPKPDTASFRATGDGLMIAASRRGRSHAHKALPRDDDARVYYDADTGWHIMAVADGAGSAPFSRLGSQTAVETAITELPSLLATHLPDLAKADLDAALPITLGRTLTQAAAALDDLSRDTGHPLRSFSTTLLIGIARKTVGGWFFASISVGDGMIGLLAKGEAPRMIAADSGAYAGQTTFLRSDMLTDPAQISARIHHRTAPDFTAFMLMTDGVSDPMFASETATADPAGWAALYDQIKDMDEDALLDWLNFRIKGEHDDRTIAILTPSETPV
ncbi:PP2C family serine/threonine-protein phosphatase [Loktanella agnita]|uniref:PP2C family serine/threonine-protein phosphatase n=1 Tax=Loktanella agnita TaxID=287097 RepID=UPI0039897261